MNFKNKWKRFWTMDVHNHEGFTLVELIIVIAILAILSGVAVVGYSAYVEKANKSADEALIYEINQAFRAACIENFCDVYEITAAKIAVDTEGNVGEVSGVKVNGVDNGKIADDFNDTYFNVSNPVLKYYKYIGFNKDLCQFVLLETPLDDARVKEEIYAAFDGISGYFSTGIDLGLTGENLEAWVLNGVSAEFAAALGMDEMLGGYDDVVNMTDDELRDLLTEKNIGGFANMSATEQDTFIATYGQQIRSNLGVMYFAEDAANRDVDDVMKNVDKIMNAVKRAYANEVTLTLDEYKAYYISTLRAGETYSDAGFETFMKTEETIGSTGLSGPELATIAKALQNETANDTGISTMGALYAMAAGFFNSSYYTSAPYPNYTPQYGIFEDVVKAMAHPGFFDGYYDNQAEADVAAYLRQMGALSTNPNVDLTSPDAFSSSGN